MTTIFSNTLSLIHMIMTVLYSNGCSFTNNQSIDPRRHYPAIVADHFGWSLCARATPGSCNDRIIRCTMRDCIELLDDRRPIVALVQITHTARTECAAEPTQDTQWKHWNDQHFESLKPNEPDLPSMQDQFLRLHMCLHNQQASMVKLLCALVGLTAFFQRHDIKYLIFNGHEDCQKFQPEQFASYLATDPGVLDLHKFNILGLTGSQNHPDAQGMQVIAQYLVERLAPIV